MPSLRQHVGDKSSKETICGAEAQKNGSPPTRSWGKREKGAEFNNQFLLAQVYWTRNQISPGKLFEAL